MTPAATPPATRDALAQACMASLVGSLADNKAALGRRYAEWAISAPTLESAVAAAAMAQDELGHARATYPVLKALGVEVTDDSHSAGHPLELLDGPLPDWTALIAANLLVDGVLTTFVAACADSSIAPLAQRARKILQEEGSHRVHAEAWAKRLCRSGHAERTALPSRVEETWEHAGRWAGPAGDPGYAAALELGMVSEGPAAQRERVRSWLVGLLGAGGVEVTLAEPADWSGWDPATRRWDAVSAQPRCPFCDAAAVERVGQWGGQIITSQWRCRACGSYFEALRDDFDDPAPVDTRADEAG